MDKVPNSTQATTWAPPSPPPRPWWKRDVRGIPILLVVAIVVVVLSALGSRIGRAEDDPTVPAGTEACAAFADPANANLHPSDWRRIGHWTQAEMEAYVMSHCPEELSTVR